MTQPAPGELDSQLARENRIEEAAAAAGDRGEAVSLRAARHPRTQRTNDRRMEQRGAEARVPLVGEPREERREIELVRLRDREQCVVRSDAAMPIGEAFEQHRRLPFESAAPLHAKQSRGGVENPAHAGSRRRIDASREHGLDGRRGRLIGEAARDFVSASAAGERRGGHSPRLARGDISARQAQRSELPEALAMRAIDAQQFAAPRAPVGAEAHAVEREPEHGRGHPVLGHDRGDVRMVMLDAVMRNTPALREPRCVAGAEEVRVQVVREHLRRDLERPRQMLDRVDERRAGRRIVEIADVLRDERFVTAGSADGILEVSAERDDRRSRLAAA